MMMMVRLYKNETSLRPSLRSESSSSDFDADYLERATD
jgi:hypothetical protein